MAIISATNLLRAVSLFHLTTAYYLLTAPSKISDHNLVFILGASMDIPSPNSSLSNPSPALAFASMLLLFVGLSDLTATGLSEEIFSYYWSSQAPIRLAFFFGLAGYAYLFNAGGMMSDHGGKARGGAGISSMVCNSMIFTWGFIEMLAWFWIYLTLREERRDIMARKELRRKAEEDRL